MNTWKPYPFLRLCIPLFLGVTFTGSGIQIHAPGFLCLLMLSGLACMIFLLTLFPTGYKFRWLPGIPVCLFLFLSGSLLSIHQTSETVPERPFGDSVGTYMASVYEPPVNSRTYQRVFLVLRYRQNGDSWLPVKGNVLGYIRKKNIGAEISLGDFLIFRSRIEKMTDNSNPGTFSYVKYLHKKGISHSVWLVDHGWEKLNMRPTSLLRREALTLRDRLLDIFRENNLTGRELAVASALLLGYVNDIDNETRREYAASGAMHILSVSGMHVGIIYVFLEFLLGFLKRNRYGRYIKAIIMLFFIFLYSMITGLSPCVIRAAIMLSLPIIASMVNRTADIINVIAVSGFIMVTVDPSLLNDIGFQLSYLAVIGIVTLYKPIYDLYITSAWLPDKIWSLLAVSIAAQLATLPITLYAFHQFPNLFMLTNIMVVPLSSIIIYVGILLLVVGHIPLLSFVTAKVMIFLVKTMNLAIHLIEGAPGSTTTGIYITGIQTVLLLLIIGAGGLCFKYRNLLFLAVSLSAGIFFMLSVTVKRYERLSTGRFVVYNIKGQGVYEFSEQNKAVTCYTTPRSRNPEQLFLEPVATSHQSRHIKFHRSYWIKKNYREISTGRRFVELFHRGRFLQFGNLRIAIIDTTTPNGIKSGLGVDLVIITGGPRLRIRDIIALYHPRLIILDGTNPRSAASFWIREAANSGVPCHDVIRDGAFEKVMNL